MSQSHNPTDTQALLQSMLQRLKLQPGRDGQAYLHTTIPAAPTQGQEGQGASLNPHKVNSSPIKHSGVNGVPSKECMHSEFGQKRGASYDCEVDSGVVSISSQKDNNHGDMSEKGVMGKATQPGITPTGTGQLFPAKSLKDSDITSFQRNDGVRVSFGSSGGTGHISPNTDNALSLGPNLNQGFTPKVYTWSLKNTEADAGGQQDKVLHEGNGGAFPQRKDEEVITGSQNITSNNFRRTQRSSENKTRRWTQRIKERFKDRSGAFGKKGKGEAGTAEQRSEHRTEISPADLVREKKEERSQDNSTMFSTKPEDNNTDGPTRSTSDFDFGLGSFSLLDEIVTGQEWAKFLNPNLSVTQRAPEESQNQPQIQTNPHDFCQSSAVLNPFGGGNNHWSFSSTEPSPHRVHSAQTDSSSQPISMDVSEGKQSDVHRGVDQTEPMEDMQPGQSRQSFTPPSPMEPAGNVLNPVLKSRVQLSRKRQHQPAERREERLQADMTREAAQADRGHSASSQMTTNSHMKDETGSENLMPLYTFSCQPTPLSPSSSHPFAPAPRGVLKHSISQEESSMETMTKRRRVEENRRVRFSEEVFTIASPDVELDSTDSEEDSDSGAEEDSVTEQDCVVEQAVMEQVAPSRRPGLTAWMRVLKRKNTGRKPR